MPIVGPFMGAGQITGKAGAVRASDTSAASASTPPPSAIFVLDQDLALINSIARAPIRIAATGRLNRNR